MANLARLMAIWVAIKFWLRDYPAWLRGGEMSEKDLVAAIKKALIEISHNNPTWRLIRGRESLSAEQVIGKLDKDKKFRKFVVTHYVELAIEIENRGREVLDKTPILALDIIDRLELENRNLVGRLGAAQERIRTLENQVKLLTTAQERIRTLESQVKLLTTPHKPWWRRLFRREEQKED